MTDDLSELKRLAEAAAKMESMAESYAYRLESGPLTILSLIARVEKAEALLAQTRQNLADQYTRADVAEARVKVLEKALRACLEQAEGCWLNHYPDENMATASTPLHIADARSALGDING
jgi:chromosome segregation ATPase